MTEAISSDPSSLRMGLETLGRSRRACMYTAHSSGIGSFLVNALMATQSVSARRRVRFVVAPQIVSHIPWTTRGGTFLIGLPRVCHLYLLYLSNLFYPAISMRVIDTSRQ